MNILAIGAHGDDLEEFCGGTLALYAQAGHHVVMAVATDGRGNPTGDPLKIATVRQQEAQASANLIGAELAWMALPDGGLLFNEQMRHVFIETIRAAAPDVIITHPADDYHPDHVATHQLVLAAAQIARTANYPSAYPPVRKPTAVAFMDAELGINFLPEEYVDISAVWETKVQMLLQHRSQHVAAAAHDPDLVLPEATQLPLVRATRILSEFRGLACGARYAEGFRWWRAANRIVARRLLP
jgi:LmbE family N-acetylglucosaminyl deacetylase